MITPELVAYIWAERKKGISDTIIRANLSTQGWDYRDFQEAIATLPPPHAKIDGDMLRNLGPNTVWISPGQRKDSSFRKRKSRILIYALLIIAAIICSIFYNSIYSSFLKLFSRFS